MGRLYCSLYVLDLHFFICASDLNFTNARVNQFIWWQIYDMACTIEYNLLAHISINTFVAPYKMSTRSDLYAMSEARKNAFKHA